MVHDEAHVNSQSHLADRRQNELPLGSSNSTYGGLGKLFEIDCVRYGIDSDPVLVDSTFCRCPDCANNRPL